MTVKALRGALIRLVTAIVLAVGGVPTVPREASVPIVPHEPSGAFELSARVVERDVGGSKPRVTLELTIVSPLDLANVRVTGALQDGPGFQEAFGIPSRVVSLNAGGAHRMRYTVDLERGRVHHLIFSVSTEASTTPRESTAYLRVNLDPDQQPEELGHVLQYRAKMGREAAP